MRKLLMHKQAYVTATFLLTVGLIMAFAAPRLTEPVSATPPGNIFIKNGQNGGGGSACTVAGNPGRCYTDLQAAIIDASSGATLYIGSGGYSPSAVNPYYPSTHSFIIDKSLTIIGDSAASVLLVPPSGENAIGGVGDVLTGGNTLVIVRAPGVTFQNVTIDGDNPITGGSINARNGIVVDYALNGVDGSGLSLRSILLQHFGYRGVYAGNPGNGNIVNFTVANSTIQHIGGSGDDVGVEVMGSRDNTYITDSLITDVTTGVVSGLGSDIQLYRNSFTFVNRGVYIYSPRNGISNAILGNAFANPQGSNSIAIQLRNHDANPVIMNNTIVGFGTGVSLTVDDAGNYSGQTEIYANFITNVSIGIDVIKSANVNLGLVIGRNGEPNKFSGNQIDVRLNPGMNNYVLAQYNIWSGGRTFAQIEPRIIHKGIMPSGSAAAADSNDNGALGQVDYNFPTDSLHSITLNFPVPEVNSIFYNTTTGVDLMATATYDPYGVGSINFRIGNKANSSMNTCEKLYNLPSGGSYDLGDGSSIGNNQYRRDGVMLTGFSEGTYTLCAFMLPGSGMPRPAFNLSNASEQTLVLDNSAPLPPTVIGWTSTNPPTNLPNPSASTGFRGCGSWVGRDYLTGGSNVWNSVGDTFSGVDHYNYQVYSPDYGRINNVAAGLSFSSPSSSNYYHLPLSPNGIDDGDYYVRISATDKAQNSGAWSNPNANPATWCRFRVDTTSPSLTIPNYSIPEGFGNLLLTATGSDANGISGYEWDLDNNGSFETNTGNVNTATLPSSNFVNGPATRTVRVRTSDPAGNVSTVSSIVTITNISPLVSILSNQTAIAGLPASLVASFVDPGQEGTWTINVNYGDTQTATFTTSATGNISIPAHTYASAGTYNVSVSVNDGGGAISSSANITVNSNSNNNVGVAINANPVIPNPGQNVNFTAVITNPSNVTITAYNWNFGDGNTASGANVSHTYGAAGNYNVTLVVTTQPGGTFNASTTLSVITPYNPGNGNTGNNNNGGGGTGNTGGGYYYGGGTTTPVTIDAGSDQQVEVNVPAVFAAKTTGPSAQLTYKWDFGDGTQGTGANATHAYNKVGAYLVRLTVSGYSGGDLTDSLTVTVVAAATDRLNSNTDTSEFDAGAVQGASTSQAKGIFGLPLSTLNNLCGFGLVIGLIAVIAFLIWRRRKEQQEEELMTDSGNGEDEFDSYLQRRQGGAPETDKLAAAKKMRTRVKGRKDSGPRSLGFKI